MNTSHESIAEDERWLAHEAARRKSAIDTKTIQRFEDLLFYVDDKEDDGYAGAA
jgi:hypothetical protein